MPCQKNYGPLELLAVCIQSILSSRLLRLTTSVRRGNSLGFAFMKKHSSRIYRLGKVKIWCLMKHDVQLSVTFSPNIAGIQRFCNLKAMSLLVEFPQKISQYFKTGATRQWYANVPINWKYQIISFAAILNINYRLAESICSLN